MLQSGATLSVEAKAYPFGQEGSRRREQPRRELDGASKQGNEEYNHYVQ